jgi:hypothetical protein
MDIGAIADGIVAYVQPLIDKTDGSLELLLRQVGPLILGRAASRSSPCNRPYGGAAVIPLIVLRTTPRRVWQRSDPREHETPLERL